MGRSPRLDQGLQGYRGEDGPGRQVPGMGLPGDAPGQVRPLCLGHAITRRDRHQQGRRAFLYRQPGRLGSFQFPASHREGAFPRAPVLAYRSPRLRGQGPQRDPHRGIREALEASRSMDSPWRVGEFPRGAYFRLYRRQVRAFRRTDVHRRPEPLQRHARFPRQGRGRLSGRDLRFRQPPPNWLHQARLRQGRRPMGRSDRQRLGIGRRQGVRPPAGQVGREDHALLHARRQADQEWLSHHLHQACRPDPRKRPRQLPD